MLFPVAAFARKHLKNEKQYIQGEGQNTPSELPSDIYLRTTQNNSETRYILIQRILILFHDTIHKSHAASTSPYQFRITTTSPSSIHFRITTTLRKCVNSLDSFYLKLGIFWFNRFSVTSLFNTKQSESRV